MDIVADNGHLSLVFRLFNLLQGQVLQLLLHPVHLEAALSVGGLGSVDLLGLIGGDVQVSNNLADVVSKAPWQNCVPWVLSTAGSVHLCATEGLGLRSLPVFDRL